MGDFANFENNGQGQEERFLIRKKQFGNVINVTYKNK